MSICGSIHTCLPRNAVLPPRLRESPTGVCIYVAIKWYATLPESIAPLISIAVDLVDCRLSYFRLVRPATTGRHFRTSQVFRRAATEGPASQHVAADFPSAPSATIVSHGAKNFFGTKFSAPQIFFPSPLALFTLEAQKVTSGAVYRATSVGGSLEYTHTINCTAHEQCAEGLESAF